MKKLVFVLTLILFIITLTFCTSKPEVKEAKQNSQDSAAPQTGQRLAKDFLTDCKKLLAEARHMDSILLKQTEVDPGSANQAIKAFTDFAYYCQSDSMSPVYLIKTAQVARAINNIPQAEKALRHCIDTYLDFKNRPAAIFLLAQLYDEKMYLNDENEAKKLYEQIINDYPKSDWAINSEAALKFLGKTDEEIIQEFNKRQKSKKS